MVPWSTVAVLLAACAAFGAFCAAVARAFFRSRADGTAYRMAGVRAACFLAIVVGCLMARDAWGVEAAAALAVCLCAASFPLCLALERRWRTRGMAAAVAYLQLHRPPQKEAPAGWDSALDSACARLARSFDLTRREEDVLRLLVEGRTFSQAADELVVSLNTVKSHVRRIYAKMGVAGKQDLLDTVSAAERDGRAG
ncbi:response regulator transcription factor [Arabiibacter massiliensis]|uniref:response regulator transcription factor n=1 Tax=Arabiibacter massiliensis TaxID=1870985 RepID=UPI0009BAD7D1|nr:helix-turn-helix transcriptional regulator [Arabiibacter massiliensis]